MIRSRHIAPPKCTEDCADVPSPFPAGRALAHRTVTAALFENAWPRRRLSTIAGFELTANRATQETREKSPNRNYPRAPAMRREGPFPVDIAEAFDARGAEESACERLGGPRSACSIPLCCRGELTLRRRRYSMPVGGQRFWRRASLIAGNAEPETRPTSAKIQEAELCAVAITEPSAGSDVAR